MNERKMTTRQIRHSNATTPYTDDYTLYETPQPTSKGDAKMTKMMKALDMVLQNTGAGALNSTTLFYWNGEVFTGTQEEVHTALKETTREKVQAVLTHGDQSLYATIDGWYNERVEQEVLGQIETWEDFKALLPEEYEQDLLEIYTYLHSREMILMIDLFYEKLNNNYKDEEEVKSETELLDEVLQDTEPGTMYDTTIFFTDGTYETGTIYTLAGAVDGRDRKEIRAAISHGTEQLLGALDGWDSDIFEYIYTWEELHEHSPEEYEQVLQDLWNSAKADVEQIVDKVYDILETQEGEC